MFQDDSNPQMYVPLPSFSESTLTAICLPSIPLTTDRQTENTGRLNRESTLPPL